VWFVLGWALRLIRELLKFGCLVQRWYLNIWHEIQFNLIFCWRQTWLHNICFLIMSVTWKAFVLIQVTWITLGNHIGSYSSHRAHFDIVRAQPTILSKNGINIRIMPHGNLWRRILLLIMHETNCGKWGVFDTILQGFSFHLLFLNLNSCQICDTLCEHGLS